MTAPAQGPAPIKKTVRVSVSETTFPRVLTRQPCVRNRSVIHIQVEYCSLANFLESRLQRLASNQAVINYGDTEFEVESVIGIKPDPVRKNRFLYLTTFVGCVNIQE
jgi:hypothetical protein